MSWKHHEMPGPPAVFWLAGVEGSAPGEFEVPVEPWAAYVSCLISLPCSW